MDITYDITDIELRKKIIKEIESDENLRRKEESFRRSEIYKKRQAKYILERLAADLGVESARDMRTFTSINLTQKMIHELASIYKYEPWREFSLLNETQLDVVRSHYKYSHTDVNLKKSNRMYKLHEQCALKCVPKNGFLKQEVLQPHHYDVIPNKMDQEKAEIYVVSAFDRSRINNSYLTSRRDEYENRTFMSDGVNQKIGDNDDWNLKPKIYYWWNSLYNFATNQKGEVLDSESMMPLASVDFNQFVNPIQRLPFVDIASDKDFEYWVRSGSSVTEFNIDFGTILSDNVNINKNQGFSQAVITSVEAPKNIRVGPDRVMWLKINKNAESPQVPKFEFVTPSPDMQGSLETTRDLLKYFLVGESINIKQILEGSSGNAASGIDHLLSMIEKFEASQDDFSLFYKVEQELYEIMILWHNAFRKTSDGLNKKVDGPEIPEMSEVNVKFGGPTQILSQTEKLDFVSRQLELGLMTPVEAIEELREVDEDVAEKIYEKIKSFDGMDMNQLVQENNDINQQMDIPDDVSGNQEV